MDVQEQEPDIRPGMPQESPQEPQELQERKMPNECPSCGAPLKDVPDVTDSCPHCGHEFDNSEHFGAAQWHRNPRSLRDTGE